IGDRTIVRFASGQQDGDQASFNICEGVDFRVAPSARAGKRLLFLPPAPTARASNGCLLLPPFPPAADRWAFTCVESIICVSVDRPFPASSRNRFSQIPRRAPRTKRL